jgi:hypothetical protein
MLCNHNCTLWSWFCTLCCQLSKLPSSLLSKLQDCLSEFYTSLSALHAHLYVYVFFWGGVKYSLLSVMCILILWYCILYCRCHLLWSRHCELSLVLYSVLSVGLPSALLLYAFFRHVLFAVGTLGFSVNALRFVLILYSLLLVLYALMLVLQSFVSYCVLFCCYYTLPYHYCTTSC